MTDLLERIAADLDRRLAELRPLLEEHTRLTQARDALGRDGGAGSPAASTGRRRGGARRTAPRPTKRRSGSAGTRTPRGENRRKILAVIAERPGVSAAEIASVTGITKTVAYSTLTKLAGDGAVEKVEVGSVLGYRVPKGEDSPASGS
jgi:DNA-binding transcriptional ArsR family regulator